MSEIWLPPEEWKWPCALCRDLVGSEDRSASLPPCSLSTLPAASLLSSELRIEEASEPLVE